jgi:hypothetical protein
LFSISTPNSKYAFSRSREKISEKKSASISAKLGSKESRGNTEEKVGLCQAKMEFQNFFVLIWVVLKTLTIDLVHLHDIITAENVGTGIPFS